MTGELKPCPWTHIGGTHRLRLKTNRGFTAVNCECGARGPGRWTHDTAIMAWNSMATANVLTVRQIIKVFEDTPVHLHNDPEFGSVPVRTRNDYAEAVYMAIYGGNK